ncbi:hypothetical protein BASA60_010935 [Batrachochytrium salamandrivorans]|nr:hypothetical protein BASA60_010935 [Batrachochytrium salamandrivorans]
MASELELLPELQADIQSEISNVACIIQPSAAIQLQLCHYIEPPLTTDTVPLQPSQQQQQQHQQQQHQHQQHVLTPELLQLREQLLHIIIDQAACILRLSNAVFWSSVLWTPLSDSHPNNSLIESSASSTTTNKDALDPRLSESSAILAFLDSYLQNRTAFVQMIATTKCSDYTTPSDPLAHLERSLEHSMFCIAVRMLTPPSRCSPSDTLSGESTPSTAWMIRLASSPADLAASPQQCTDDIWYKACLAQRVLTCPRIVEICRLYSTSNSVTLSPLITTLLSAAPDLLGELTGAFVDALDAVHSIQRKRQKGASLKHNSNGKGKGKGKMAMVEPSEEDTANNQFLAAVKDKTEILAELGFFLDLMRSMETVVLSGGRVTTDAVLSYPRLIQSLIGIHDLSTMHYTETTSIDVTAAHAYNAQAMFDETDGETSHTAMLARTLKRATVSLLGALIFIGFIRPAQQNSQTLSDFESSMATLCDFTLSALEQCAIDGPVLYLRDAPLLLDFEIEFRLYEGLQQLLQEKSTQFPISSDSYEGFDPTRINYLIMSLEQLVTFSGNANTCRSIAHTHGSHMNPIGNYLNLQTGASPVYDPDRVPDNEKAGENISRAISISFVSELFPDLGDGFY